MSSIPEEIKKLRRAYEESPSLDRLAQLREIMVDAQNANNATDGFRKLLTDLYPDTAHFVYELLQNAQDASKCNEAPSSVRFKLSEGELEFEHCGKKLFTVADVDAITSLGVSTKRDDNTSIGKFGIGFKSVFAYTLTPKIHSGDFHFMIKELFVPEKLPPLEVGNKTRFFFPFNNHGKSPADAFKEIEHELRGLNSETLLFLNNINKIEYSLPDGNTLGVIEQISKNGITTINVNSPDEEEKQYHWLCYDKEVAIVDENGKSIICRIAIAFQLDDTMKKIVPVDGKVCIFFPAEKETSNLHFYIHAPFASTVARDSVRACDANNQLRNAIAELVSESLSDIKRRGMLTVDFLGILPNGSDHLSEFYEPIRKAIVDAFKSEPLVPTKNGSYAPATALYRVQDRHREIGNVIDDKDLSILTGKNTPLWVKNPHQLNQREDKFLDSLEIDEWGVDALKEAFSLQKSDEEQLKIENWIANKPDEWLMRLYALLLDEDIDINRDLKIVRTTKDAHVKASDAYFPPEDNGDMPIELHFVKPEVYCVGEADKRKNDASGFLKKLEVKLYDERTKVELRLSRYRGTEAIDNTAYFEDMRYFINYSAKHLNDKSTFANERFLIGERDGKDEWVTPAQIHIIPPDLENDVIDLKLNPYRVWSGYRNDTLGESAFVEFFPFLKRIGVEEYNEHELMAVRADRYKPIRVAQEKVEIEQIFRDTEKFLLFSGSKELLQGTYFVLGEDGHLHKATEVSIGVLAHFSKIHGIPALSAEYGEYQLFDDLENLLSEMGAVSKLKFKEILKNNSCLREYEIEFLDMYLDELVKTNSTEIAHLIWDVITYEPYSDEHTRKQTRLNKRHRRWTHTKQPTELVIKLTNIAWIPDRDGKLHKPQEMTQDMLPDGFKYGPHTHILTEIKFGEVARLAETIQSAQLIEQKKRLEAVDTLGITVEDVEIIEAAKDAGITKGDILELAEKKQRKVAFPTQFATNPERRTAKLMTEGTSVENKIYVKCARSVRLRSEDVKSSAREYLTRQYTNDHGQMMCQICKDVMPFRKRNGEYYFEAVEAFDKYSFKREHEVVYLALCPVCAAKYKEFVKLDKEQLNRVYEEAYAYDFGKDDGFEIPVRLDVDSSLKFTEMHLGDIQAVLKGGGFDVR